MAGHSELTVLFPTGSFYPAQTGGPDNSVYWLTKALMRQGTRAVVVATDRGLPEAAPRDKWLEKDFADIIYTKNRIHYFPLKLIRTAFQQLKDVDILHLTMIFYPASFLLAVLNLVFYQKPMVWSIRGDLDPHMLQRSSWKKRPVLFMIRHWLKDHVVFHSTCAAETRYVKALLGEDIEVIELTNYMELPEPVAQEKEPYLLYLGRIDPKKAIEHLIEALDQSSSFRRSGYHLKIVGDYDNAYGQKLLQLVHQLDLSERVTFVGHASGARKQQLLAAAYFLIMPSHTENFGIVVAEALAQSTPAVASIHTPWQVLEPSHAGYWVDNAVDSLAACIDRIIQLSPEEYEFMRSGTRPLVVKAFDVHANIGRWQQAYRALLQDTEQFAHEYRL